MKHTMIVMIFYSFDSFNIWTCDLELKTRKVVFISDTDIFGGIDSPKKQKKENNSGGKMKIDDYFGSKYKKESCLFKIFLNVF